MKKTISGRIPQKRGDTLVKTIEKEYGVDFGVRSNMKLTTYLLKEGLPSMSKALKNLEKKIQKNAK